MICPYYIVSVHIDKKVKIPIEFKNEVAKLKHVNIKQKYRINWGSYYHILAVIDMLQEACQKGYQYYHILSGNTFPIQTWGKTEAFFEKNQGKNFVEVLSVKGNVMLEERQKHYYYYHLYDIRSKNGRKIDSYVQKVQNRLNIKRNVLFEYKGYFYCHLTQEFVNYLFTFMGDNRRYLKELKTMEIPEEFFFQNIIMNSEFKDSINNNLIFNDWSSGGGSPASLSLDDWEDICKSGEFYARKIRDFEMAEYIISHIED